MASILVLNGPNLNLLGTREPEVYGADTLEDINARLSKQCQESGHDIEFSQSNAESEIINKIHQAKLDEVAFIIINPAAFTHTSVALRDAFLSVEIPFIEVHLSNVYKREEFRHKSLLSDIAEGCIIGLGAKGYELALTAVLSKL